MLIGIVPQWEISPAKSILNTWLQDPFRRIPPIYLQTGLKESLFEFDKQMNRDFSTLGVQYVSALEVLCHQEGCRTRVGADSLDIITFDGAHLTVAGSQYLIGSISQLLFPE